MILSDDRRISGVKVCCENKFVVARRIVDHPPQQILGIGLVSGSVQQADQTLAAFRRRADAIKLPCEIPLAQLFEELTDLAGGSAAKIGGVIARTTRTAEDVRNGSLVDARPT